MSRQEINNTRKSQRSTRKPVCYDETKDAKNPEREVQKNLRDALDSMATKYPVNVKKNSAERSTRKPVCYDETSIQEREVKKKISAPRDSIATKCQVNVKKIPTEKKEVKISGNANIVKNAPPLSFSIPKGLIIRKIDDIGVSVTKLSRDDSVVSEQKEVNLNVKKELPQIDIKKDSPQINTKHSIPQINIKQDNPQLKTKQNIPQMDTKKDIPQINIGQDIPQNVLEEVIPQNNIKKDIPQININKDLPQNNIKKDIPQIQKNCSPGRVVKKLSSSQRAIVKTIKKLNQDQKKKIEGRLSDIGSNLKKIKAKEEEPPSEPAEPVVEEKKTLTEVLSDPCWMEMFLKTEPTVRYDTNTRRMFCLACRRLKTEEDKDDNTVKVYDDWVEGLVMGKSWLRYREHKLSNLHQASSTKFFLQLFNAQRTQNDGAVSVLFL